MTDAEIRDLVLHAMENINLARTPATRLIVSGEAAIFGADSRLDSLGLVSLLIDNAGIASMNPVALTPFDTARAILSTNVLGTFLFTHAALRLLRASTAGRIVNFTTVAVPFRLEGEALYAASKSAVETFTRIVAREAAPLGITCNAVGPSPVRTQLTESVGADRIDRLMRRQAIPRWAEPADV